MRFGYFLLWGETFWFDIRWGFVDFGVLFNFLLGVEFRDFGLVVCFGFCLFKLKLAILGILVIVFGNLGFGVSC